MSGETNFYKKKTQMTSKSARKVLLVGDESKVQLFASFENEDTGEEFQHTFDRPEIVKIHPVFEGWPPLFFGILRTTKPVLRLGKSTTVLQYTAELSPGVLLNFEISLPKKVREGNSEMVAILQQNRLLRRQIKHLQRGNEGHSKNEELLATFVLTPDLFTSNFPQNKAKIDWLLTMKADVNKAPFGEAAREYGTVWTVLASGSAFHSHSRKGASYLLLKCGADVNMKKASGAHESLFCAFLRNTGTNFCSEALKAAQLFLECGADVEQADDEKKDALWICADLIENHPYKTSNPGHYQTHVVPNILPHLRELLQAMKAHAVRTRSKDLNKKNAKKRKKKILNERSKDLIKITEIYKNDRNLTSS